MDADAFDTVLREGEAPAEPYVPWHVRLSDLFENRPFAECLQ